MRLGRNAVAVSIAAMLVCGGHLVRPRASRADGPAATSSLLPAGDFDGDGRPDVIVRTYPDVVHGVLSDANIEARRGVDGTVLWTAQNRYSDVVPATVGPGSGQPGVYGINESSASVTGASVVVALGPTGQPIWTRALAHPQNLGFSLDVTPVGHVVANVVGGAAEDVVLAFHLKAKTVATENQVAVLVFDGADGTLAYQTMVGVANTPDWYVALRALGDLTGDGLAEYGVAELRGTGNFLHVRRGESGASLFDVGPLPVLRPTSRIETVPDATGDGHPDLLMTEDGNPRLDAVVDGNSGTVVLTQDLGGNQGAAVGDINGDGLTDFGGMLLDQATGEREHVAMTASGTIIYDVFLPPPPSGPAGTYPAYSSTSTDRTAGDVDGDGLSDWVDHVVRKDCSDAHLLSCGPGLSEWRTVSGATGADLLTWTSAPATLTASFDGAGTDLLMSPVGGFATAVDGRTGAALWTSTVPSGRASCVPMAEATPDLDGDGVPDLKLIYFKLGAYSKEFVISGATGAILWTFGLGGGCG
ncbi:MAG: trimeric autotransporter adhesin [Actinomycetota bacterium]|jgi:hypothetical protein|nr:trimeric autotransporter adhesin [Actinomycetota bacterium]